MYRIFRLRKAHTTNALLEYGISIGLIMVAAIATVFLVARLASGQWTVLNAIFQ